VPEVLARWSYLVFILHVYNIMKKAILIVILSCLPACLPACPTIWCWSPTEKVAFKYLKKLIQLVCNLLGLSVCISMGKL
jgi:hypothetical protein